ncbi:MAG: ATP-dependent DNA helicase, partial [Alphaproteobacteria bacterium]|nr:ATP-dependent DNA helicase [Alphaproteobacteria bacterium]
MSTLPAQEKLPAPALPAIAVLAVNARETALLTEDGEIQTLSAADIPMALHKRPVMLCHAPYIRSRLGDKVAFFPYDLLELFAFVHPGRFCVPTPVGLAKALGLAPPQSFEDYPFALLECAQALLSDLQREKPKEKGLDPAAVAQAMGLNGKGWPWAPFVCAARGVSYDPEAPVIMKTALNVWKYLPELTEDPPPAPPAHHGVTAEEAQERLVDLLGTKAEKRKEQLAYTANITTAFAPAEKEGAPHFIMAEAGTGVGKTLGYLAPASLWAEKNDGAVWVSTFTKNLQRQI